MGGELVQVTFNDPVPEVSMAAVKAVIEAYMKVNGETDSESTSQKIQTLESMRQVKAADLKGLNDRIMAIANEYGSSALTRMYEAKLDRLNELELQLQQMQVALTTNGAATQPAATQAASSQPIVQASTTAPVELTVDAIARRDPQMREYLAQKRQYERELERYGQATENRHAKESRRLLEAVNKDIDEQARAFRTAVAAGEIRLEAPSATAMNPVDLDPIRLRERQRQLQAMYDQLRDETLGLGRKNLQIESLRGEADTARSQLARSTPVSSN